MGQRRTAAHTVSLQKHGEARDRGGWKPLGDADEDLPVGDLRAVHLQSRGIGRSKAQHIVESTTWQPFDRGAGGAIKLRPVLGAGDDAVLQLAALQPQGQVGTPGLHGVDGGAVLRHQHVDAVDGAAELAVGLTVEFRLRRHEGPRPVFLPRCGHHRNLLLNINVHVATGHLGGIRHQAFGLGGCQAQDVIHPLTWQPVLALAGGAAEG